MVNNVNGTHCLTAVTNLPLSIFFKMEVSLIHGAIQEVCVGITVRRSQPANQICMRQSGGEKKEEKSEERGEGMEGERKAKIS